MRFLVDECTGADIAVFLRDAGHDVEFVGHIQPGMTDVEILRHASRTARIVVTLDKDFGDLIFRDGLEHRGLVLLRLGNPTMAEAIDAVRRVLQAIDELSDRVVVATPTSVRIRDV